MKTSTFRLGRLRTWAIAVAGSLCAVIWLNACALQPLSPPAGDGMITGVLYARAGDEAALIPLPPLQLQLKDAATNKVIADGKTEMSGYYTFDGLAPGDYRICLQEPNWEAICGPTLPVSAAIVYADPLLIKPQVTRDPSTGEQQGIIWGRVRLADDTLPTFYDSLFQLETKTEVELLDEAGHRVGRPSQLNNDGEFFFSNAPATVAAVRAWSGKNKGDGQMLTVTVPITDPVATFSRAQPVDLTLANDRPVISDIQAPLDQQTRVGDSMLVTVTAMASDPQDDLLEYRWFVNEPDAAISGTGATIRWRLPPRPGLYTLYLLVDDGKGAYASKYLRLSNEGDKVSRPNYGYSSEQALLATANAESSCNTQINGSGSHFNYDLFYGTKWLGQAGFFTATNYYRAIDPDPPGPDEPKKNTLIKWWQENGFDPVNGVPLSGTKVFSAQLAYLNTNPLGVGRFLRCRLDGMTGNAACYVANHGDANGDPLNAKIAADKGIDGEAIVAMEYSPAPTGTAKVVKFYAFEPKNSGGRRIKFAQLGGNVQVYLPNLCLYCHGAKANPDLSSADLGATFREIDGTTYCFPDGSATPNITESKAIYDLNQIVSATRPAPAVEEMIKAWYPSSQTTTPVDYTPQDYVPQEWQGAAEPLYRNVIRDSCQACHIAYPQVMPGQQRSGPPNFASYAQFKGIAPYIRRSVFEKHRMPFAYIPYARFWQDCTKPMLLDQFTTTPTTTLAVSCP